MCFNQLKPVLSTQCLSGTAGHTFVHQIHMSVCFCLLDAILKLAVTQSMEAISGEICLIHGCGVQYLYVFYVSQQLTDIYIKDCDCCLCQKLLYLAIQAHPQIYREARGRAFG